MTILSLNFLTLLKVVLVRLKTKRRFIPISKESSQIEDKATLYPYIQRVIKDLEIVSVSQQIYLTQSPDLIIAEITGKGRIASTGRAYSTNYVWMMRTKDGKLIHMRDYWNPLASLA